MKDNEEGKASNEEEFAIDETVAYDITRPKFKKVSLNKLYDFDHLHVDFEDLEDLNRQITAARIALLKLTDKINEYDRLARDEKVKYDREYRRAYINSQERTEAAKRIRAEMICEPIENNYLYYDQLKVELNRSAYAMREELSALNSAGNNLRQHLKII